VETYSIFSGLNSIASDPFLAACREIFDLVIAGFVGGAVAGFANCFFLSRKTDFDEGAATRTLRSLKAARRAGLLGAIIFLVAGLLFEALRR
jgi:hypothetical protein